MRPATIAQFLVVPAKTEPLLLIATFSMLLALAARAGLFGIPLALILLSWFFKYGFVLLDHIAAGNPQLPVLAVEMVNPVDEKRSIALLLITIALFYLSGAASRALGPLFAAAIAVAGVAILPAVFAVQALTDSVLQSLNPKTCFRMIRWLGGDYALILGCIALAAVVGYFVVASVVGGSLPLLARLAFLMYAWLAIFALLGGVLFERRDAIPVAHADTDKREIQVTDRERERLRDRQLDPIYAQWRNRAYKNAWQTVTRHLEQSAEPLDELRWMYERTARWPDPSLANRLGQELLQRLLVAAQHGEALRIVRERLAADDEFRSLTAADSIRLAELARDGGDRPTARALLRGFQRCYPGDPLQPVAEDLMRQLER